MIAPFALLLFAVLLAGPVATWMSRASWTLRSPGLGILAWQALTVSTFGSLVLAGLSLAVPELPDLDDVAAFLHACTVAVQNHYATPGGVAVSVVGASIALALVSRMGFSLARGSYHSRRSRIHQLDLLSVVCEAHDEPDVVVVAHPTPVVYCLPGRRKKIVVSQGALSALTREQLLQVLAHERAHIQARHHLVLAVADAFARTLRNRFGSALARHHIAELAEMHADDAVEESRRRDLASAVFLLAGGAQPVGTLGAAGGPVAARVKRLMVPTSPVTVPERAGLLALVALMVLTPLGIASSPALTAALLDYCPLFS